MKHLLLSVLSISFFTGVAHAGDLTSLSSSGTLAVPNTGGFQSSIINPVTGQTWDGSPVIQTFSIREYKSGRRVGAAPEPCRRIADFTYTAGVKAVNGQVFTMISAGNTIGPWVAGLSSQPIWPVSPFLGWYPRTVTFSTATSMVVSNVANVFITAGGGSNAHCAITMGTVALTFAALRGS